MRRASRARGVGCWGWACACCEGLRGLLYGKPAGPSSNHCPRSDTLIAIGREQMRSEPGHMIVFASPTSLIVYTDPDTDRRL
eukprot:2591715-Prymnesium_polylepis.1